MLFVWESDDVKKPEPPMTVAARHAELAPRLREAVEIGAVTDLQVLAETLSAGDEVDVELGRRIAALAAAFDFDGVRDLAASLEDAGKPS